MNALALHSGLSSDERDHLISRFNDPRSTLEVLVMSTMVGSVGLNLQHACSHQIMAATTASDPQERQALARLWRFGQKEEVTALKLVVDDTYAQGVRLKRSAKVVCELVAHLDIANLGVEERIANVFV